MKEQKVRINVTGIGSSKQLLSLVGSWRGQNVMCEEEEEE
jgi:hypothetical protein